jgi:deoxycytidylate deaminase
METNLEGCLIVRKDGKVVAIGHNDLDKRVVVFYSVEQRQMGLDEFKDLLSFNLPTIKA